MFPIAYKTVCFPVGDWACTNTPGEAGDHMASYSLTGFTYVYDIPYVGAKIPWIVIGY